VATKLSVYNEALLALKTRRLAALTDNRSERRDLDAVYEETLDWMLERGLWNFATKAQEWSPSDDAESAFGYQYVYEKPDDYMRLVDISDNERYRPTLSDFAEEGGFFFADANPIWVRYVSTDPSAGRDPGMWKPAFARAFALELAWRAGPHICSLSAGDKQMLQKEKKAALIEAKSADAVNQPQAQLPTGRLVRSRGGGSGNNRMRRTPYA
jgi:hypothetical protein